MPLILSGSAGLSGNVGNVTKDMLPAGSVIQVVQAVLNSAWSTNSTTFQDFLNCSITPTSLTNKILVMFDVAASGNGSIATVLQLKRNSTPIYQGDIASGRAQGLSQIYTGLDYHLLRTAGNYLDAPGTLSPVVYSIAALSSGGGANYANINRTNADRASTSYDTRSSSSLTLLEVKA